MTTTVNVKVSGAYRTTVKHGNREPVYVNGEEDRSFILSDHPMQEVFVITEEPISKPSVAGLTEDPNAAPRPTPEQIAADNKEKTRGQETLAQRDAKVKAQEEEEDRKAKEEENEKAKAKKEAEEKNRLAANQSQPPFNKRK